MKNQIDIKEAKAGVWTLAPVLPGVETILQNAKKMEQIPLLIHNSVEANGMLSTISPIVLSLSLAPTTTDPRAR